METEKDYIVDGEKICARFISEQALAHFRGRFAYPQNSVLLESYSRLEEMLKKNSETITPQKKESYCPRDIDAYDKIGNLFFEGTSQHVLDDCLVENKWFHAPLREGIPGLNHRVAILGPPEKTDKLERVLRESLLDSYFTYVRIFLNVPSTDLQKIASIEDFCKNASNEQGVLLYLPEDMSCETDDTLRRVNDYFSKRSKLTIVKSPDVQEPFIYLGASSKYYRGKKELHRQFCFD